MRIASKFALSMFALAMTIGFAGTAYAADAAGKGMIEGTVMDPDNKPVADASVKLMKAMAKKGEKAPAAAVPSEKLAADDKKSEDKAEDKAEGKGKGKGAPAMMEAMTDKDGKFSMKDVPAGDYRLQTNVKGVGNGNAMVTVKAGETATAEIMLKAPKAK